MTEGGWKENYADMIEEIRGERTGKAGMKERVMKRCGEKKR